MRPTRFLVFSAILFTGCTLLGACKKQSPPPSGSTGSAPPATSATAARIAVIPKGTTHVFWKSVERGAQAAGDDLGLEIIWRGPVTENDRAQQIQLVQQFISEGVNGIVLAPLDFKALVGPVAEAKSKGIPVVIMDSALEGTPGTDFVSFVATNNLNGGKLAGEALARLLNNKGDVVVLRYQVGSASTDDRERGFLEAVGAAPEIKVVSENRYAGATAGEAKTAALNMMDQIRAAGGVFAPNESSTLGMLLALQQEGLAGKIRFVGFDASPPLVDALKKGEIDALVVQNPTAMGEKSVRALAEHLAGRPVEAVVDTGAVLVTRENMNDESIKRLIE